MHAGYEVWKVWDRKVWPPEDYDAIYKNAQSPTILHFPPPRLHIKNISKIYFAYAKPYKPSNQPSKPYLSGYQTIALAPYCPYQTSVIGHMVKPSYQAHSVSGISGISSIQGLLLH